MNQTRRFQFFGSGGAADRLLLPWRRCPPGRSNPASQAAAFNEVTRHARRPSRGMNTAQGVCEEAFFKPSAHSMPPSTCAS
jgi:hypothetical protein